MPIDLLLAFAAASAVVLVIPGPTVMIVVSYVLGQGRRSALATVPGVALGDLTAMSVSLAGAGAVLQTSATLFTALKIAGAVYLIWLGIGLWRNPPGSVALPDGAGRAEPLSPARMFRNAYLVTALNPKSIAFFVAFVPQFVSTGAPVLPQFVTMIAVFVGLAAVNVGLWALAAGEMRRRVATPGALRLLGRIGGGMLIGAGGLTAIASRTA